MTFRNRQTKTGLIHRYASALGILRPSALALLFSILSFEFSILNCQASNVVFSFTNTQTMLLDTNDFKIISKGTVRNADGTFNITGLPIRVHNPTGIVTNYLAPQYYQVTNQFIGEGFYIRIFDAGNTVVYAGDPGIYLGSANPFVELVVNTNGAGGKPYGGPPSRRHSVARQRY